MVLALVLTVGLAACGKQGGGATEGEKMEVPTSALEILEKIWGAYGDEEKFFAMGGDYGNPVENAPGNYDLKDEGLVYNLQVPADQLANIDQAATLVHSMMLNNFGCGVYHVTMIQWLSQKQCTPLFPLHSGCAAHPRSNLWQ